MHLLMTYTACTPVQAPPDLGCTCLCSAVLLSLSYEYGSRLPAARPGNDAGATWLWVTIMELVFFASQLLTTSAQVVYHHYMNTKT